MSARASVSCERVRARLDRLLDRSLSELEEARDRGHLEACASCASELAARRAWWRGFRELDLPDEAEFAWLTRGLAGRLAEARAPQLTRRAPYAWRRAGAAAALAAAALLALALADAWGGARPIEELFASAPRPELPLGAFEIPWFDGFGFGGRRRE